MTTPLTGGPSVATFDVFDTVLTRSVGSPRGLFWILGNALSKERIITCSTEAFVAARLRADRHAYARLGRDGGVSLDVITEHLAQALNLDERAMSVIKARELDTEARMLQPVPDGLAAVEDARHAGKRVRFLSDMYLPEGFVREQLQTHGLWVEGDMVLVSGEMKASKQTGRLYDVVARRERVAPGRITHVGNDKRIDVVSARRRGVSAVHLPAANLTDDEAALDAAAAPTEGLATAMAGAARLARLRVHTDDAVEAAKRDVATDVIGPLLIAYVLWLLHRAADLGLRSVYFLSRDGQVLFELAKRLQPRLGPEVAALDLSYLMASREAWNIAALQGTVSANLPWILSHASESTPRGLLRRLGLCTDDPAVGKMLIELGIDERAADQELSAAARGRLHDGLNSPRMAPILQRAADHQRELVTAAFAQAGVFDGRAGFVDVVARGTQQRAAMRIASAVGAEPPVGLMAGIQRDDSMPPAVRGRMHAWLYDDNAGLGFPGHLPVDILFVAACAADHGTLLGYTRNDGAVVPVLHSAHNQPVLDWGLDLLRRSVMSVADALEVDQAGGVNPRGDLRQPVVAGVMRLWSNPRPLEAEAWGTFPYEYGSGTEPRYNVLASPATLRSLLRQIVRSDMEHWSSWTHGAVARATPPLRSMVTGARRLRRVIRRS